MVFGHKETLTLFRLHLCIPSQSHLVFHLLSSSMWFVSVFLLLWQAKGEIPLKGWFCVQRWSKQTNKPFSQRASYTWSCSDGQLQLSAARKCLKSTTGTSQTHSWRNICSLFFLSVNQNKGPQRCVYKILLLKCQTITFSLSFTDISNLLANAKRPILCVECLWLAL